MKRENRPAITIIMPSYNVARYIRKCVESVLTQTFQNMEILIIDAGSDDGTWEILHKYTLQDSRIKLLRSDIKSYGYQVNMGIRMAKGVYIGIVETDDFIEPDMYQVLYERIAESEADYVRGRGMFYREITKEMITESPIRRSLGDVSMTDKVINPGKYPELVYSDQFLWLGLYRAGFIQSICLNETPGAAYQDIGFMLQVHYKARRAVYIDKFVYHYRLDNGVASSYDKRAFQFLVQECNYSEKFLGNMSCEWRKYSALAILRKTQTRFYQMAYLGHYWESAVQDIEYIRQYLGDLYQRGIVRIEDMDRDLWACLQLFLESPQAVYDFYKHEFYMKSYDVMLLREKIGEKDIVIFGAGKRGKFCHMFLAAQEIGCVKGFCDNDTARHGSLLHGLEVRGVTETIALYPDAIYLTAGRNYADEMGRQLLESGISEKQIVSFKPEEDEAFLRKF